ncbi:MAG: hypothetical protein JXC36_09175 [Candidatus Atribacteria bacterium]|nr:hypothetical protein [Candidatus Atribacteria bacterium]
MVTDIHISTKKKLKPNLDSKEPQNTKEEKNVRVQCPSCGLQKVITLSKSSLNLNKPITVISIPPATVCAHHFQIFVDKNLSIRSYQKVDFILPDEEIELSDETKNSEKEESQPASPQVNFLEISFQGNSVEYDPPKKEDNPFFKTNYDKLIQLLLDKITCLNELFNTSSKEHNKEDIKFSIQILEDLLKEQGKCQSKALSFRDYQSLEEFILITAGF